MHELFDEAAGFFRALQEEITSELERLERDCSVFGNSGPAAKFIEDNWTAESRVLSGGGGRSRILENGRIFERAGVNFSDVRGEFSEEMAKSMPGAPGADRTFRASGISLVLHPTSPRIPTVHANFRVIQRGASLWFGGGADLTPYYLVREDAEHFHTVWRDVCKRHTGAADYARFKKTCDEYFYLPHRGECRGIGGIFYDYLTDNPGGLLAFTRDAGRQFLPAYVPIVERHSADAWGERERNYQLWRRGRYVEFNLIHDRGTIFGMKTGGRAESILMSLPPLVRWTYNWKPEPGSPEEEMLMVLKSPVEWIS